MCGCLSRAPYWGSGSQPRHVPWLGIEPATLWFAGPRSIHWARAVFPYKTLKNISVTFRSINDLLVCVPSHFIFPMIYNTDNITKCPRVCRSGGELGSRAVASPREKCRPSFSCHLALQSSDVTFRTHLLFAVVWKALTSWSSMMTLQSKQQEEMKAMRRKWADALRWFQKLPRGKSACIRLARAGSGVFILALVCTVRTPWDAGRANTERQLWSLPGLFPDYLSYSSKMPGNF